MGNGWTSNVMKVDWMKVKVLMWLCLEGWSLCNRGLPSISREFTSLATVVRTPILKEPAVGKAYVEVAFNVRKNVSVASASS